MTECLLSTPTEPIICDGGCGLSKCPMADPNLDIIGLEFHSSYRGDRFDFTTTVTGTAEWNPQYVNVTVVGNGKTQHSSRRAEHVRMLVRRAA